MDINQITGYRIKEIRTQRGFTAQAVADVLNLTKGAYSNIENGKSGITVSKLDTIAQFFEVPITELLGSSSSNNQTINGDHGLNTNNSHNNTFNNIFVNEENLERAFNLFKEALRPK